MSPTRGEARDSASLAQRRKCEERLVIAVVCPITGFAIAFLFYFNQWRLMDMRLSRSPYWNLMNHWRNKNKVKFSLMYFSHINNDEVSSHNPDQQLGNRDINLVKRLKDKRFFAQRKGSGWLFKDQIVLLRRLFVARGKHSCSCNIICKRNSSWLWTFFFHDPSNWLFKILF